MERIWSCFVHGLRQASKPIKSRPSQAEGPQPGESLLISSHRKLHTERASLGHSNIQNEACQALTAKMQHPAYSLALTSDSLLAREVVYITVTAPMR